jgi:hypothetical protein
VRDLIKLFEIINVIHLNKLFEVTDLIEVIHLNKLFEVIKVNDLNKIKI